MLTATDISFTYGRRGPAKAGHYVREDSPAEAGHYVLNNVSLSVERGSIVGLLGPN